MKPTKGYYTTDINETYWYVIPVYSNAVYTKAKVTMYYKNGQYKDHEVDTSKFKLYHDRINHWKPYDPKS